MYSDSSEYGESHGHLCHSTANLLYRGTRSCNKQIDGSFIADFDRSDDNMTVFALGHKKTGSWDPIGLKKRGPQNKNWVPT